jgi:GDP-4-dehydro-6-deoxy-D-mannose reductase
MRVLITGISGFAGSHFARLLLRETPWTLIAVSRSTQGERDNARINWWQADLRDGDVVHRLIRHERPDVVVHMAAQASVPTSWQKPWETYQDNIQSQLNLFEAINTANLTPRIIVVSSNEVYGRAESAQELPYKETHSLRPNNPYAVSKVTQDMMALQYRLSHKLDVVVARPFNHVGPNQSSKFVVADFANQIAQIEQGLREPVMRLGNMEAQRDFTDVRDVARAYLALIKGANSGQIYNVCSGVPRSIQSILNTLFTLSPVRIKQETDPNKFRKIDTPVSYGDATKLRQDTGWEPVIPFEQTLSETLDYWREQVRAGAQGRGQG